MKKFILGFIMAIVFFAGATTAYAKLDLGINTSVKSAATKAGYSANTSETTFAETLGMVVKAVLSFVGVIFLALMVYAGFKWMNARGDEAEIDKSKEIIKSAIIGLIITVGAYSITAFVVPRVLERTAGPGGGDRGLGDGGANTVQCCRVNLNSGSGDVGNLQSVTDQNDCSAKCAGRSGAVCQFLGARTADECI